MADTWIKLETEEEVTGIEEEELTVDYGHDRCIIKINPSHTLQDVRRLIVKGFDDEMFPENDRMNWAFWVDNRRVLTNQECEFVARDFLKRRCYVEIRSRGAAAAVAAAAAPPPPSPSPPPPPPPVRKRRDLATAFGTSTAASSDSQAPSHSNKRPKNGSRKKRSDVTAATSDSQAPAHSNKRTKKGGREKKSDDDKRPKTRKDVKVGEYFVECPFCLSVSTFKESSIPYYRITKDDIQFVDGTHGKNMVDTMFWHTPPRGFKCVSAYQGTKKCIYGHQAVKDRLEENGDDSFIPPLFRIGHPWRA